MAPILLWLILVLCLLISAVKYLMGIILKFSFAGHKSQKGLRVSAQRECADALLQRRQDGLRDDREHQQE
jgi:hypothetical protein